MLWASLYITICSAKNRIRARIRRLREPKYLIGAIVGAAYFYFTIFARMWGPLRSESHRPPLRPAAAVSLAALGAAVPAVAGLALMIVMALGWVFPVDSGLLQFTDAEVQFLFPAPVSRRQLLLHRLMRSQIGLLFAAIVPALIVPSPTGSRAKFALSIWIILVTIKVHFTGITLARASLRLHGADARHRQWVAFVLTFGSVAIIVAALARSLALHPVNGLELLDRVGEVASSGLPRIVLWPFIALVRPILAQWRGPYLLALAGAAAVLAANVIWVLSSDTAFQEAAAEAQARSAAKKLRAMPTPRSRANGWTLPLTGRPETFFLWKNVMQMLRETNMATVLRYGAPVAVVLTTSVMLLHDNKDAATAFGTLAGGAAVMTVIMGPQIARTDLRQDLLHLELLKTWPIRASAVIRGEMLWPAAMLTMIVWFTIGAALTFSSAFLAVTLAWRVSAALAAALMTPALVAAQLTIHNAAAVVFPAWVPLGTSRPRGIEAMGQRLIMLVAVLLGLLLMMAPGVITGGIIWFIVQRLAGPLALIPAAAACTAIVLAEVLAATEALGAVFERLDLSGIERAE